MRAFVTKRDPFLAVPPPSHRHAQPSGPWPWMDLGSDASAAQAILREAEANVDLTGLTSWKDYPQNHFPNWLPLQVDRCGMKKLDSKSCTIYALDVKKGEGQFISVFDMPREIKNDREDEIEDIVQMKRGADVRLRALFLESLSNPVLCALGTKYEVEPFFYSSSVNWIPARYQEQYVSGVSDHITIVLPFIRAIRDHDDSALTRAPSPSEGIYAAARAPPGVQMYDITRLQTGLEMYSLGKFKVEEEQVIDTQKPLRLGARGVVTNLVYDLLAVHLVRNADSSTIISYHAPAEWRTTSAEKLKSIMMAAGQSVYWQKIFKRTDDPTFTLLTLLWYPLYAWDEALEKLYEHISHLESRVIKENNMQLVRSLHIIQAHLLHYASLMQDFRKSVLFVQETPYPASENDAYGDDNRTKLHHLMNAECEHMLSEIDRLEQAREMQSSRLKNVMDLAFAMVNIQDSKEMRKLTEATVRDSAAMRQISYLTMFFLPASFAASVFGMNVREINGSPQPVWHYIVLTVSLTVVTIWIIVAFEADRFITTSNKRPFSQRLLWPFEHFRSMH